jgi:hypothetical protein
MMDYNRLNLANCVPNDTRDMDAWWYELEGSFDVLGTSKDMSDEQIAAMLTEMRSAIEGIWSRHSSATT